jgi:hypothetical protein
VINRAFCGFVFLFLLAALFPACDSYNLSFKDFFTDGNEESGGAADTLPDGGSGADAAPDGGGATDNGSGPDIPVPPAGTGTAKAITSFNIISPVTAEGIINEGAKTIAVTVPYGTALGNLITDITVSEGASIYPASGEAQDFSYDVIYTVTAADGSTAAYTVKVTPVLSLAGITAYLNGYSGGLSAADPVPLPVDITLDTAGWPGLLAAIDAASPSKYAALDISACAMSGTEFDPDPSTSTGKDRIVSLVLPDGAESIKAGNYFNPVFKNFTALKNVSGENVETIGDYAFDDCTALSSVSLPAATTFGFAAFDDCTALSSVSLPAAETVGDYAFAGCTTLSAVSLPAATTIGNNAFDGCTALSSVSLPVATTIGEFAFRSCTTLTTVSLPTATTFGYNAFYGCTALSSVSLPAATTIGESAFDDCTALSSVSLPTAETISLFAFEGCTALSSVSLPATPPVRGEAVFWNTRYGSSTGITIYVAPPGTVSDYNAYGWVDAAAGGDASRYGSNHNAISIAGAP